MLYRYQEHAHREVGVADGRALWQLDVIETYPDDLAPRIPSL
jgi:hypothetical protein